MELPEIPESSAYVLRTVKADGTSYNGFAWNLDPGAINEAPDWDTKPECGGGLHGLLDGYGNYGLLSDALDAKWLIVEVERAWCVDIDQKVKFPACTIAHVGGMASAMTRISQYQIKLLLKAAARGEITDFAKGDGKSAASSGNSSKAASSGNSSTAASSGDCSKAASSGYKTIAMVAGFNGMAKAGPDGCIALAFYDGERPRIVIGYVGEGIDADTYYRVEKGLLVKA